MSVHVTNICVVLQDKYEGCGVVELDSGAYSHSPISYHSSGIKEGTRGEIEMIQSHSKKRRRPYWERSNGNGSTGKKKEGKTKKEME